ncbi:MAG: HXXEE domain-containing protein [Candidatus Hermodarchaeota archaeon]
MKKKIRDALYPAIFVIIFITIYGIRSLGTLITFGSSMALAYLFYMLTNYKEMPEPERTLPVYLIALGVQLLHFIEEFTTGLYIRFPTEIYNSDPYSANEFVISQMVVYFLFIIGALGIFKGWNMTMIFVWFLLIMMLIVNSIQHPIYSIMVGGYFPGLYTSFAGIILAPILFKRLWEVRDKFSNNLTS